jgi:predicted transposase/invertase (TIGR01784 family)
MKNQIKIVRFDWAIKNILRKKANFGILEDLISQLLKTEVKIQNLIESESNKAHKTDKSNRVDILVETPTKEKIIIEVQCNSEWDYMSRILYGVSKVAVESLNQGDDYAKISKIVSISIVFFDLGQGEDYVYHGTTEFRGLHTNDTLKLGKLEKEMYGLKTNEIPKILPEYYLLKVKNFYHQEVKDMLDEWMYFLKTDKIKDNFKSKGVREAYEKLQILKLPEVERQAYNRYMEEMSLEASLAESKKIEERVMLREAKEEGRQEEKIEIAKSLFKAGIPIPTISYSTGLSIMEIEKLQ